MTSKLSSDTSMRGRWVLASGMAAEPRSAVYIEFAARRRAGPAELGSRFRHAQRAVRSGHGFRTIEQLGGLLEIASAPGKETTVRVSLPAEGGIRPSGNGS